MIKRTALDAVFSDLIRESWDWTCARCGRECPDRKGRDFHCSHFISRAFNSTRWFPDNALCLCAACHDVVGKDPGEHYSLLMRILGPVRYDELKERKHRIVRYREAEKKAMTRHYRGQIEHLLGLRADGVTGFIDVMAWD